MFESPGSHSAAADLPSAVLAEWVERVGVIGTGGSDAELIDQIAQLERLKSACAAAQAALSVAFVASRTAGLTEKEIKDERVHRSIAAQVALARRDSPFRGGRHVGLAKALVREMPNTYAALRAGEISEWRATLLVRETACLTVADRQQVDAELAGKLGGMGDRQTAAAAMRIAQKLDPKAWVDAAPEGGQRTAGQHPPGTRPDGVRQRAAAGGESCCRVRGVEPVRQHRHRRR